MEYSTEACLFQNLTRIMLIDELILLSNEYASFIMFNYAVNITLKVLYIYLHSKI